MFNDLKLAFQSFKKNIWDYLSIAFVFSVMLLIGVLVSQFVFGPLIAFVSVVIPAIIGLKFCAFHSYNKEEVEYRNMKIGFLTFFKSLKIYFIVFLKPFLISFVVWVVVFSMFYTPAIELASASIPNLYDNLLQINTMEYVYKEMLGIASVKKLLVLGLIVSLTASYLVYFSLKLKRDFIPFIAFEMPINRERSVDMNVKMIKGKYLKLFIPNLIINVMYLLPVAVAILVGVCLRTNEVYSELTIFLVSSIAFCIFAGPIAMLQQLHYVHNYKSYSKPFKEDFDNELKSIIKEIEELQKKINKN